MIINDIKIKTLSDSNTLLAAYTFYTEVFKDKSDITNPIYSYDAWLKRMDSDSDLLIYASLQDRVIGIAFGRLTDPTTVIIGPVAVNDLYKRNGIARFMLEKLETNAKSKGVKKLTLGALKDGEGLYKRLAYEGYLLIQSEKDSIDEILEHKGDYQVKNTNRYNDQVNQVCLFIDDDYKALQGIYEEHCPNAYLMMYYEKYLKE